jgi:predicted regulator of Ras-like GTPase activity (Roadblock/LC7/MglB family)
VGDPERDQYEDVSRGTSLLPADLTVAQIEAAPVLVSADSLVIDELTDQECDNFIAAVRS